MNPSTFEIILFSLLLHLGLLLFVSRAPEKLIHSGPVQISINYSKKIQNGQKPLKSSTFAKPLNLRKGEINTKKDEKIDLTDYANQLKVLVDPIWVRNTQSIHKKYYLICLIFPRKDGSIRSVKVIKSSGYTEIDQVAISTFREIGSLPQPPDIIVEKGIEWDFQTKE